MILRKFNLNIPICLGRHSLVTNKFLISKRFQSDTPAMFVHNIPAETNIHELVNSSQLFNKILDRFGAKSEDRPEDSLHVFSPITGKQICSLRIWF